MEDGIEVVADCPEFAGFVAFDPSIGCGVESEELAEESVFAALSTSSSVAIARTTRTRSATTSAPPAKAMALVSRKFGLLRAKIPAF